MDESRERVTAVGRARRGLRPTSLLLALLALGVEETRGAAIRNRTRVAAQQVQGSNTISAFLAGGPEVWARVAPPRFPAGMRLQASADGLLEETPLVEYLRWRRALNPQRFDRNHRTVGPQIERDRIVREGRLRPPTNVVPQVVPVPQLSNPSTPSTPPPRTINPRPQDAIPPVVPEPSSLAIGVALAVAGGLYRRARMRGRAAA